MNGLLKNRNVILFLLFSFGIFLRFYNLNWGSPFYFHPDERNIASSVSGLHFPNQLNPHFFAYGSLPIYSIYAASVISNVLSFLFAHKQTVDIFRVAFEQSIVVSRIFSACFSLLISLLLYRILLKLKTQQAALFGLVVSLFSVGLIQFAHFGTFEMWLTFFSLLLFSVCLRIKQKPTVKTLLAASIILGLLLSIKISSFVLVPIPLLSLLVCKFPKKTTLKKICFVVLVSAMAFAATSPFALLDFSAFKTSINYESSVALRTLPVFYTQGFYETFPVVFQFTRIYPFLINPLNTILFIPSFLYVIFIAIKQKSKTYLILTTFYLILFLSQAFFFAKWTRYMVSTLPFVYLIITIAIDDFFRLSKEKIRIISIIIFINFIFLLSYFVTVFAKSDTRTIASTWGKEHIRSDAKILSEVYDLGITPFNRYFSNIQLFDFYGLDSNSSLKQELQTAIEQADYVILPSQRIMRSRLLNKQSFPRGYSFYYELLNKKDRFQLLYQTPCDIFCRIAYLGDPIFNIEETANVFDRPTLFIFKKLNIQ